MLAQQMHGYNGEQHEIAVKNELPACTRENGLSSCLWERSTVINQSSNLLQIFQWGRLATASRIVVFVKQTVRSTIKQCRL